MDTPTMLAWIEALREARSRGIAASANDTYATVHSRLSVLRGPAFTHDCITCGNEADAWAFQGSDHVLVDPIKGLKFSLLPDDYAPMCRECHQALDKSVRDAEAAQ